jgi:hypothetical protein
MRLSERLDYEAAPDDVFAMITDKAFREDVCKAAGALSWSVEVDTAGAGGSAGAGAAVTVRRVMPADVPDMVKKLVGDTIEVVQTEQWEPADGAVRRAEVLVEISGQPARMIGTATIGPSGAGALLAVDGDLKVAIPLLGGKLEKEVARGIRAALRVEHRRGVAYLSA